MQVVEAGEHPTPAPQVPFAVQVSIPLIAVSHLVWPGAQTPVHPVATRQVCGLGLLVVQLTAVPQVPVAEHSWASLFVH